MPKHEKAREQSSQQNNTLAYSSCGHIIQASAAGKPDALLAACGLPEVRPHMHDHYQWDILVQQYSQVPASMSERKNQNCEIP